MLAIINGFVSYYHRSFTLRGLGVFLPSQGIPGKKYEEFAYVIGIKKRTRSVIIRNKTGDMLYVIGQKFLNIIEILIDDDTVFETGEKISIGTENRSKILSVLGRVPYKKMPDDVADTFSTVIEGIVAKEEQRFVKFINTAGPLNYKNHALKAIPQISEKISQNIINERDDKEFDSYMDIEERAGVKNIVKNIADRIKEEIIDDTKINMFVKK